MSSKLVIKNYFNCQLPQPQYIVSPNIPQSGEQVERKPSAQWQKNISGGGKIFPQMVKNGFHNLVADKIL